MIRVSNRSEVMLADDTDRFIGSSVLATGEFEFDLVAKAVNILGPRRVIVDVGANIGTVCVPAVARGLAKRAIAVEPDPFNFRLLRCNTILNEVDHLVTCVRAAAGDRVDTVRLELAMDGNLGDHRVGDGTGPRQSVEVPMQPLAPLLEPTHDDLVWIDVQGSEAFVLAGWPVLAATGIPTVVEICPEFLRANGTLRSLVKQLGEFQTFTDLRFDDQRIPTSRLPKFVDSIPDGQHRDLLMR
jgi:FkbM family methyltransferase